MSHYHHYSDDHEPDYPDDDSHEDDCPEDDSDQQAEEDVKDYLDTNTRVLDYYSVMWNKREDEFEKKLHQMREDFRKYLLMQQSTHRLEAAGRLVVSVVITTLVCVVLTVVVDLFYLTYWR